MTFKLNGWQRLWIAISALGFVTTALFLLVIQLNSPNNKQPKIPYNSLPINMQEYLIEDMSQDLTLNENVRELLKLYQEKTLKPMRADNNSVLYFKEGTSNQKMLEIHQNYNQIIKQKANSILLENFLEASLIWSLFCSFLYILGCAVAWIRRGFQSHTGKSD